MFTGVHRIRAHAYLSVESRPGEPVRLADGYPAPASGVHAFVVELETKAAKAVTLPVYVPAAVLVNYEAFVLFVLEETGEMLSCEAVERERRAARQSSAWRRHVARALGAGDDTRSKQLRPGDVAVPTGTFVG